MGYNRQRIMMKKIVMIVIAILFSQITYSQCTYSVSSGTFRFADGTTVTGYSGVNNSKSGNASDMYGQYYYNNTENSNVKNKGAIPCGAYYITGYRNDSRLGQYTIVLSQDSANDTYGRDGFRIHGDNSNNNASHGCIILGRDARAKIAQEYDSARNRGEVLTLYVYE